MNNSDPEGAATQIAHGLYNQFSCSANHQSMRTCLVAVATFLEVFIREIGHLAEEGGYDSELSQMKARAALIASLTEESGDDR